MSWRGRSYPAARNSGMPGTVYLLHFNRAYRHARHYTGWTQDLAGRLAAHAAGTAAKLTAAASAAGVTWVVARTWDGDRHLERRLKNRGGAARICPLCKETQP